MKLDQKEMSSLYRGILKNFVESVYDKDTLTCMLLLHKYKRLSRLAPVIHSVCAEKNVLLLEAVLGRGADPNILDEIKLTPLGVASNVYKHQRDNERYTESAECIKMLVKYGAHINELDKVDSEQLAPVHYAAYSNNVPGLYVLYAEGADLLLPDSLGETPLHTACAEDNYEFVKALLNLHPAAKHAKNELGYTPLDVALKYNNVSLYDLLNG